MDQSSQVFQDVFLQYTIFASAIAALCTGYFTWSFKKMLIVYVSGVFLGMLVVVPDWEYFTKRHVSEWIEPMASDDESRNLQRARFPILKKTAKYAKRISQSYITKTKSSKLQCFRELRKALQI